METVRRILLADPESATRSVVAFCLREVHDVEVLACASGAEALERAAAFAPHLLVLDASLPGPDGFATLAALREQGVDSPAVFITARPDHGDDSRYRRAGAAATIAKPFDPLGVARALCRILEREAAGVPARP